MNFKRYFLKIFLLYTLLLAAQFAFGSIRLPKLVSDGMVLQRGVKTKIWGWASPGEKVCLKFIDKNYSAITAPNGTWAVKLAVLKVNGPHSMYIRSGKQLITINDILAGDVWFCSGQSNMVLQMERVKEKFPEDICTANYSEIRNFFIPTSFNVTKTQTDYPAGKWVSCTPITVLDFGATSYFFARQLYKKYHVPIGIINSSIGGTPIQAWISADGIKDISIYANRIVQLKDSSYINHIRKATLEREAQQNEERKIIDKGLTGPLKWFDTSYTAGAWHHYWLPGYWADQGVKGLNGIVWFRKEFNIPDKMTGKNAKLYMGW
jgi:sialate O-acetylesterase